MSAFSLSARDIEAVRANVPDAADDEICELLGEFAKRGLKKPVGYAIRLGPSALGDELAELRAKRKRAEARKVIDQIENEPPCPHGQAGGQLRHPMADRLWCVLCDREAKASGAGIGVPTRSLAVFGEDLGDSGDSGVSPDSMPAEQPERISGDSRDSVTPRPRSWTAAELLDATFPRPRWAIEGLIPEGVMLLAGAPKVGKSWLALDMCVSVAAGGKALGSIGTTQGEALYLALEDTPRRLQQRLRQVLGSDAPPDGLTLAVEWPSLPAGADQLAAWLEAHPDARLVVIDVFERIRGPVPLGTSAYTADYIAVRRVKELADRFGVAIVLIHHMRKMSSGDFLNEVSGTLGLSGAADTIAVLKRSRGELDGTFNITGRDVEENEWAMKFAADMGAWQLVGLAGDYGLADTRRQLLDALRGRDDGASPKELADATGLGHELVKKTLARMAEDGQVQKDRGRYYPPIGVPGVPDE
jgi:hypothetical protein